MIIEDFMAEFKRQIEYINPEITVDVNGILLFNGFTVISFFMTVVYPNKSWSSTKDACSIIGIHGINRTMLLNFTEEVMEDLMKHIE